jgi:cytochrome c peroxidase
MQKLSFSLLALLSLVSFSAQADVTTATQAASDYGRFAKALNPKSTLSAEAGRAFYTKKVVVGNKDISCAACHTDNPANSGKHNESGNPIKPMAPSVNPQRFSSVNKSAAAFSKHCRDLYGKDCSAQDKGDFITYLLTIK